MGRRLALFVCIGLLSFILTACKGSEQNDPRTQAPLVKVATVQNAAVSSRSFKIIETLDRWLSLEKVGRDGENQVPIMDMEPDERNQRIEEEIKKLLEKINTSFSSIQIKESE